MIAYKARSWSGLGLRKKARIQFVSEGRDCSRTGRCLLATSFYEYTAPKERKPKIRLQDHNQFVLKGEEWFWIAGIVKNDCFAMLAVEPGPDVMPSHDRQIVVLAPNTGMDWLSDPSENILRPLPRERLEHRLLRKNGVTLQ